MRADEIAEMIRSSGNICCDCAETHGAVWPDGHLATWWLGVCTVCKQKTSCCCTSDWEWPDVKGRRAPREH